ncbi:hypothetical protein [Lentzea tibetensis]|nr:hypothetical protein [Lentzea tibetensis]
MIYTLVILVLPVVLVLLGALVIKPKDESAEHAMQGSRLSVRP